MTTFRSYVEGWAPVWLLRRFGSSFVGLVYALSGDELAETWSQAVRMPWLKEPSSPDDVLPLVGAERRMPRYPIEDAPHYRDRLWHAWDAYEHGGSATVIEEQLAAAGFPGVVVYGGPYARDNWWSQFWAFFPQGTHPITSPGPAWGSFDWGDGTAWGPEGITSEQLSSLRALIKKWKHTQWVCRGLAFEISGWAWGTGHTWGEAGLVWGGEVAHVGAD